MSRLTGDRDIRCIGCSKNCKTCGLFMKDKWLKKIESQRQENKSLKIRVKEFAETIALLDSQSDKCPECGVWRTEEMKDHLPTCTVNKIDEWLD